MEKATFAGGCFWCTEAFFKEVRGVIKVTPGYSGGDTTNPTYDSIHSQDSGHAECIQVEFDPESVSYKTLVKIFFGTHDPTQVDGQGNDHGKEYRSIILYHSEEQKRVAEIMRNEIAKQGIYTNPIVTTIEPFVHFFDAEPEHMDFYKKNPGQPYCQVVIDPKITKFRKQFQKYI